MSHEAELWAKDVKAGSGTLKAVLRALAWYADATGLCWPSQERIAEDTELSIRAVRNAVQALAEAGLLTREERRRKDGTRQSDLLRLAMGQGNTRHEMPDGAINRHLTTDQPASDDTSTGTSRQINRHEVPVLYEPSKELLLEEPSASDATVASASQAAPAARPPNPIRQRLLDDGLRRLCAITGRSQHSGRQFIGFALGIANDDAGVVLDLIEQADDREVADPTMWVERQLRRRREIATTGPPSTANGDERATGQTARVLEVQRQLREREHGTGDQHDDDPAQPALSRGEDRGIAWQSRAAPGPSEPLLRAAGQGGHDSRASSALRRQRSA